MKFKGIALATAIALTLSLSPHAIADDATDRSLKATGIAARWNPIFDSQQSRILALAIQSKKDKETWRQYNTLLLDFNEVRRVINAGLASTSSDLDAVSGYAEEETGEFASTIAALEKLVASIKSITCVKGKSITIATGIKPACPKGYTKKK